MGRRRATAVVTLTALLLTLLPYQMTALAVSKQAPIISSSSVQAFNSTTTTQKKTYNPQVVNGMRNDIGKFSVLTSMTAIEWNVSKSDYLEFTPPSIGPTVLSNSAVYYNSTETIWQMGSGLNSVSVYIKPGTYSANIFIQANLALPQQVCMPFIASSSIVHPANTTYIQSGNEVFSWNDVNPVYSPTWSSPNLCLSLPAGLTIIDPLAIDGTGHCATGASNTCNASLTTSASPDVIIVIQACASGGGCGGFSISDTSSLSWTLRLCQGSDADTCASVNGLASVAEYYAIASGTLSADSITCTQTGNVNGRISCAAFGISGANTASPFDSNVNIPLATTNGGAASTILSATWTTSNANDMLVYSSGMNLAAGQTLGGSGGWTDAQCTATASSDGDGSACGRYKVVSVTQSGTTVTFVASQATHWATIADAVKQSGATVNQTIIVNISHGAPAPTITIGGSCGLSNSSFIGNNNSKKYTGVTSGCSTTLTVPATGNAYLRYCFNVSPKPKCATAVTFSTSAGTYTNTSFYQTLNNFTESFVTPSQADGTYTSYGFNPFNSPKGYNDPTGIFLGTSVPTTPQTTFSLCDFSLPISGSASTSFEEVFQATSTGYCINGIDSQHIGMWADWNTPACNPSQIGNSWSSSSTNCFTDTTGHNSHSTTYVQSARQDLALFVIAAIVVSFLLIAVMVRRR